MAHLDVLATARQGMAGGGDVESVPAWDMAVLVGAALMLSTFVIVTWTQPVTHAVTEPTEILTLHTGVADASITLTAAHDMSCTEADPCAALLVYVVPAGEDIDSVTPIELLDAGHGQSNEISLNQPLEQGEYHLYLDGEGEYAFEVTISRAIPHEYTPALIGALLLVWGIWRKQQEDHD